MSLSFNLLEDTNIIAKFLSNGKNLSVQFKQVEIPKTLNTSQIIFIGSVQNVPQVNISKVTNDLVNVQIASNTPSSLDIQKGDIIEVRPLQNQILFSNTSFAVTQDDQGQLLRFTIEDPTKNIILTEGHTLNLSVDSLGSVQGKAMIPEYILFDNTGNSINKTIELVEQTYTLPYNSEIKLNATPLNTFKLFEATDINNQSIEIFNTKQTLYSKHKSLIWILIIVLAILVIIYFKYNKDLKY